jgi:uncharacterized membrane protein (DUF441 family)
MTDDPRITAAVDGFMVFADTLRQHPEWSRDEIQAAVRTVVVALLGESRVTIERSMDETIKAVVETVAKGVENVELVRGVDVAKVLRNSIASMFPAVH